MPKDPPPINRAPRDYAEEEWSPLGPEGAGWWARWWPILWLGLTVVSIFAGGVAAGIYYARHITPETGIAAEEDR